MYRKMYFALIYDLHVHCALVDQDSAGSPGVCTTPGLTSITQVVCVCVRAHTSTHLPTTLTPTKVGNIQDEAVIAFSAKTWLPSQQQALTINKLKKKPLPIPSHARMQVLKNTCDTHACSREIDSTNKQNKPTGVHMYNHTRVYIHVYAYIYTLLWHRHTGLSRSLVRTFTRCNWVEVASA